MSDPSLIRSVQQTLNDKGFNAGSPDGIMRPHTEAALKKFQRANSLEATGQLDSSTVAALGIPSRTDSGPTASNATTGRSGSSNMNTTSSNTESTASGNRTQ